MTVLRVDASHGTIIHCPLWPIPAGSADLSLDVPAEIRHPMIIPGLPGVTLEPGSHARGLYITAGDRDLCAHPAQLMTFLRARSLDRFEFLVVEAGELATLRLLVSQRWSDDSAPDGDDIIIVAEESFALDTGAETIDIRCHMPRAEAGAPLRVRLSATGRVLRATGRAVDMVSLAPRPAWRQPAYAETLPEWQSLPESQLCLSGEEEIYRLPVTVSDADIDWFYEKPFMGADHPAGRVRCRPRLMRERDKYVMMARNAEGVIFDEAGVCNEAGYLQALSQEPGGLAAPVGMQCDRQRRMVDRQVLDLVPNLAGAYAVFTPALLANYTHWLIDGLLILHVMLPYLPDGIRLLLPATLRELAREAGGLRNHHDTLAAFGFADLPFVEVSAPYCRVEEVYFLDDCYIKNMPAEQVQSFRLRALNRRSGSPRNDQRIHIGRRIARRVRNSQALKEFLAEHDFTTYYTEDLSIGEQIDLFSRAAWVIGVHGAGFGNLLFCPPATRVIDIMPDIHFQPYFSYMCCKLGLSYAVLPCPTTDGGVNGDIILDMRRLRALFRVMRNRL